MHEGTGGSSLEVNWIGWFLIGYLEKIPVKASLTGIFRLMGLVGVEPTRGRPQRILSPRRLPFPPQPL